MRLKVPEVERLENLLANPDLFAAIAAGYRRQAHADCVADSVHEKRRQPRRGRHDPFHSHSGLGEPHVEREIGFRREATVDRN